MIDIFTIPRSNVLSFCKDNQDLPTLDNRLLQDDLQGWRTEHQYFTKFDVSDEVKCQFITNRNLSVFTIEIYDYEQNLVDTILNTTVVLSINDSLKVYQFEFGGLVGKHYIKMYIGADNGFQSMVYYSQYFEFGDYNDGTIYKRLAWSGSANDGIFYADTQPISFVCRVPIGMQDVTTSTDATIYTSYDSNTYMLHNQKKRLVKCVFDPVPLYFALILDLAVSHENVTVNGQQFVISEEGTKLSQNPKTNLYELIVTLIDTNYENYYNLLDTNNSITVSTDGLAINDDDVLLINETDILEI